MASRREHGRQNGGSVQRYRDSFHDEGEEMREAGEQAGEFAKEQWEGAREEASRRYRGAEDLVRRNPMPSVLAGFGIGFATGLVLTTLLGRREEIWAERHFPETYRGATSSLQNLSESIRNLPEAIARRLPGSISRS